MKEAGEDSAIRLDKWLFFARFFKSRSIAASMVKARKVRVNGNLVAKASVSVSPGDVLTFPKADAIKVIKIVACGDRRGPYTEAITLYEDMSPEPIKPDPASPTEAHAPAREKGMGRPTKADRRAFDKLRNRE